MSDYKAASVTTLDFIVGNRVMVCTEAQNDQAFDALVAFLRHIGVDDEVQLDGMFRAHDNLAFPNQPELQVSLESIFKIGFIMGLEARGTP